jgi:hypothetical protein
VDYLVHVPRALQTISINSQNICLWHSSMVIVFRLGLLLGNCLNTIVVYRIQSSINREIWLRLLLRSDGLDKVGIFKFFRCAESIKTELLLIVVIL